MAEEVGQGFKLVGREIVVVPLVVAVPAGPLDTLVTHQVEVTLCGVVDPLVHHGASQGIAAPVLVCVGWEKPEF